MTQCLRHAQNLWVAGIVDMYR